MYAVERQLIPVQPARDFSVCRFGFFRWGDIHREPHCRRQLFRSLEPDISLALHEPQNHPVIDSGLSLQLVGRLSRVRQGLPESVRERRSYWFLLGHCRNHPFFCQIERLAALIKNDFSQLSSTNCPGEEAQVQAAIAFIVEPFRCVSDDS